MTARNKANRKFLRRAVVLCATAGAVLAAALPLSLLLPAPAAAQFFPFFAPFQQPAEPKAAPVDSSRAPAPKKPETPPTTTIVVMGDSMADWLAYGLEDAFADTPEIGIVRKHKAYSGLIRYQARSDLEWPAVARDILTKESPAAVIMILGLSDRRSIEDSPDLQDEENPAGQDQNADDANSPNLQITAPEPKRGKDERYAYRTEQWAELYAKLIDKTIAALKSKGVPVIWVGLPAVRGTKSTSDTAYLNDLFRAQAEKAGIVYVDIWDGFIDEAGKFTSYGPDVEGQPRRLRSEDGVHFTKAGARKLAHYVERELRRVMSVRTLPVAFPSDDGIQAPGILRPGLPRPAAGPVVPLTADAVPGSEELLGGGTARVGRPDPIAERVLVKGEAIAPLKGRADDFVQTPAVGGAATAPSSTEKSAVNEPALSAPAQVPAAAQPTSDQKPGNDAAASGKRTSRSDETAADSAGSQAAAAQPAQRKRARDVPRPPAPLGGAAAFIPFNWFR